LYVKFVVLTALPFSVLTVIVLFCDTFVLLNGTKTTIFVGLLIVIPVVVVTLLIVIPVIVSRCLPEIVSIVPVTPVNGEKDVIVGGGHVVTTVVVVLILFVAPVTPAYMFAIFCF